MYRFMGGGERVAKSMNGIPVNPRDPKERELMDTVHQVSSDNCIIST
jgi:hypothetical protein